MMLNSTTSHIIAFTIFITTTNTIDTTNTMPYYRQILTT